MTKLKENQRINRNSKSIQLNKEGPNWVLLAGSALLSTLIVRLGFTLSRIFHDKNSNENASPAQEKPKSCICQQSSTFFCYRCSSDIQTNISNEQNSSLPVVKFNSESTSKSNADIIWSNREVNADITWSTPNRNFQFQPSLSSESLSESGSDIYIKREVIQKLRQQLQRRDEMILEMQTQISNLKNALNIQINNSSELEAQVEGLNREVFESEREIQRLRKVVSDCVGNGEEMDEMERKSEGKMEMIKKEIEELREIIEGKDFLIKSYKEQKMELSEKVKELQGKLDLRVPNIL